jgi:hypothetical protein
MKFVVGFKGANGLVDYVSSLDGGWGFNRVQDFANRFDDMEQALRVTGILLHEGHLEVLGTETIVVEPVAK